MRNKSGNGDWKVNTYYESLISKVVKKAKPTQHKDEHDGSTYYTKHWNSLFSPFGKIKKYNWSSQRDLREIGKFVYF